ncbi:phosphoprotein phosphatase [Grosmannia clavigera kw1407]|uniref:Phosphoprotein phosphatase n=1 Tax=Grosmannia clavigera (strain kw1407 / UAMH 11150) TaxID=655863 RepID=F0XPV4_GROCL|nr:phosphoprotein phosphatase [Grosmannia clavigera kw1407]EFX00037.1 phosphoprotein phosphatase [Grosmannia clavigera kw1407]
MRLSASSAVAAALLPAAVVACDSCYGPTNTVEHVRHVKRIQPGAQEATYGPTRPLEWGQLNVMHTTDTHGWLEGHIKEQNYGADFGDFVSFATHLKHKAGNMGVDLLLVDTGDLHDGTGLSDTTTPDGKLTNKIFEELSAYDILTIGNHELYLAEVAYQTFSELSKFWGEKYLTSNVQILNQTTNEWQYIGQKYRYFTTPKGKGDRLTGETTRLLMRYAGLRIMAFGVLFDFKGNTNVSKVIPAATMVKQDWFVEAVNAPEPVDLFLVIGHNIARPTTSGSTFQTVYEAIRTVHADKPVQIFGGHSHIRDFAVLDESSTALESGRYCETVGWLAMSGFDTDNSGYHGVHEAHGVPNPTRKATANATGPWIYARRYLDWNRYTFSFHAVGTGSSNATGFDYHSGLAVTDDIRRDRSSQRLGELYGCVPDFYCQTCVPFGNETNIFTPLSDALGTSVVNTDRADRARMVYSNTGGIRFDMYKGPFTYDDNFIVSPFRDAFLYIPDVPYSLAEGLLNGLNNGGVDKRDGPLALADTAALLGRDSCVDPIAGVTRRDDISGSSSHDHGHGIVRRQVTTETAGYTTTDDFGSDGDDTAHQKIPYYSIPNYFMGTGGFPESGDPEKVDVIFVDFIESFVLDYLGSAYNSSMVTYYISENFTSQDYLLPYVKSNWQTGLPDCPI